MVHRPSILAQCRFLLPAAIFLIVGGFSNSALAQVNVYEQSLNVASFGGVYTRSQMLAYVRPWEAATRRYVNMVDYGGGLSEIRSQVNSANVKWDVVYLELHDVISACNEGLLEPVDSELIVDGADGTPADEDIPQEYQQECGYPSVIWATVIAFNNEAFPGEKPSSVADFFNIEKFPGNRGVRNARGLLEWALIADGVNPSDVYSVMSTPEGLQRAFDVASSIKANIVRWSSGDEPVEMLKEGAATMSTAWNGRLYGPIVDDNQPLEIIWDGQMLEIEYWAILKGTPRLKNAKDFVRFALKTENMAAQTNYIPYGPVRNSSQALISDEIKPHLPTSNLETAIKVDSEWWAENGFNVGERFEEWSTPEITELDRAVRF